MNDTTHPSQAPGSTDRPADSSQDHGSQNQPPNAETCSCAFDPIVRAMRDGVADAKQTAKDALPQIKSALSKTAYHVAYGISFAAAFQVAFLRHVCPDIIKSGVLDGLSKGTNRGASFAEHRQRRPQPAPAEPNAPTGPMEDQPSPV